LDTQLYLFVSWATVTLPEGIGNTCIFDEIHCYAWLALFLRIAFTEAGKLNTKEVDMIVICAWCQQEGNGRILEATGEKADERQSHGICQYHSLRLRHDYRRSLFFETTSPSSSSPVFA
jgi:hypothetical protein